VYESRTLLYLGITLDVMSDIPGDPVQRSPRHAAPEGSQPSILGLHGQADQEHPRRGGWARNDDLLSGFGGSERPQELRAFFASTITASLVAWDLTFTLGAYHTVFYSRIFQILVVSTVLLLGTIVLRRHLTVRPWMRALLSIPLLWLATRLIAPLGRASLAGRVLDVILIILILVCVPFTLWAAARIVAPEYFELPDRRFKIAAVSIVVLVAVTGFLVGQFNFRFTDCHEYTISGDNTPANCRNAPAGHRYLP
jgi:hypothetical protein